MFNQTQLESYQKITAPADLKERVLGACQNTKEIKNFPIRQTLYQLAPLAACLILCFTLFVPSIRSGQPLVLKAGDTILDSYNTQLPPMSQEAASFVRTISLEPRQYTVSLQADTDIEIISADGQAIVDEAGNITWTLDIPDEDMVFELHLRSGDATYYVPLQYHTQDGSFFIRCEKN